MFPPPPLSTPRCSSVFIMQMGNRLGDFPSLQNHMADNFIWVSPRADPKMKVWLQVVYLGEDGGTSWEKGKKSGVFMMLPAGTWASSCRGPSDIVQNRPPKMEGPWVFSSHGSVALQYFRSALVRTGAVTHPPRGRGAERC